MTKNSEKIIIIGANVKEFSNEKSVFALKALAKLSGATVYCKAAEAFVLIREVN
jgi:N-acetylglucosamine malate deacetylase 1